MGYTQRLPCSGGEEGAHSEVGLTERCSGSYKCTFPDGTVATGSMAKQGSDCTFGGVILTDSGVVYETSAREDHGFRWSGTTEKFQLCRSGSCAACVEQPGSTAGSGRCIGSPKSCSSLGAGSCVSDGCSFEDSIQWDGFHRLRVHGDGPFVRSLFDASRLCRAERLPLELGSVAAFADALGKAAGLLLFAAGWTFRRRHR